MSGPDAPDAADPQSAARATERTEVPELRLVGLFEYKVVQSSQDKIDASPTDPSLGLPGITGIPAIYGAPGMTGNATPGTICYVMFANQQASKPVIVGYASAAGGPPVARVGDTVQVMISAMPLQLTGTLQFSGSPSPMQVGVPYAITPSASSLVILVPQTGHITTGSGRAGMGP